MTAPGDSKPRADPFGLKSRTFSKRSDQAPRREKAEEELAEEFRQERFVREYNTQNRPEPLVDIYRKVHQKAKTEAKEEDLERRKFDWDRDMNQGSKSGTAKSTNEHLAKHGDLGSRFSSGSSTRRFL